MIGAGLLRIEPLGNHDRRRFTSGEPAIDRWFREQAGQMSSRGLAAVHLLIETATGEIAGYYALSNFAVLATSLPEAVGRKLTKHLPIPAHLLGQLGIDARFQG